ncbi:MAG: reverse transcriptase family protein, partial [Candidatus Thioglobus sp.]
MNDPSTSQKSYWKIINRVMNKCSAPKIPPILVNNIFVLKCSEKAKLFNDFFSKQCMPNVTSSVLPPLNLLTDKKIDYITIQYEEIISLIRNLNPNKATGSDGISGQMLLLCDNSVVLPLKIIFQNILVTSTYPDLWKLANVTPIFKKGDKQLIKNYRPISLLPICGKIFEKIVFNNLYSYLNVNNLITKNQSGFRPGDSTTNQLLYLVNEIHKAFEDPKSLEVRAVFLDISKAFDKVWHDGLIFKLKQNGISGTLLKLFENYLHNRKQRVVLNGFSSDYSLIASGVPQGSVLGPLLFLIYINDLESNIKSNIKFFADDTMLFSIVKEPVISANDLNHDLGMIYQWAHQWKMDFNPDPTKQATEVLFSCKKKSPNHPQLFFNGSAVVKANEQKHLGLILQSGLSFEKHISEKIIKAKKNVGILKHLSKFLPLKSLDQMYKALVRPHLDYCDIIYHIPSIIHQPPLGVTLNSLMMKVERIQYQAALAITGAWQGSSR